MVANPRYQWRGGVPSWTVRRALARAPLMVLSSIMEGGANVVSEALVAGVPVLASAIPGSIGLLGRDYPGYFPVGDTVALTECCIVRRLTSNFLDELSRHCARSRACSSTCARSDSMAHCCVNSAAQQDRLQLRRSAA